MSLWLVYRGRGFFRFLRSDPILYYSHQYAPLPGLSPFSLLLFSPPFFLNSITPSMCHLTPRLQEHALPSRYSCLYKVRVITTPQHVTCPQSQVLNMPLAPPTRPLIILITLGTLLSSHAPGIARWGPPITIGHRSSIQPARRRIRETALGPRHCCLCLSYLFHWSYGFAAAGTISARCCWRSGPQVDGRGDRTRV